MLLPSHESLVGTKAITHEPIDPKQIKADVKHAYDSSKTGAAFFAKLNRKGYALGRTYRGFAVIDGNGGKHNLKELLGDEAAKGLNKKFTDLAAIRPGYVSEIIRKIKASNKKDKRKHPARSGRIAGGGIAPVKQPAPASLPVIHLFRHAALAVTQRQKQEPTPHRPPLGRKGSWPEAAALDWKAWGHKETRRFFTKWPELSI